MKRIRNLLITLLLSIALLLPIYAVQPPTVTPTSGTGSPGDTVSVSLDLSGNPGLAGWMLELDWDSSVLTLLPDILIGDAFSGGTLTPRQDGGTLRVFWYSAKNQTADGQMLSLRFQISENAKAGEYRVALRISAQNTVDETGSMVALTATDAVIVVSGTPSDGPSDAAPQPPSTPIPEPISEPDTPSSTTAPTFSDLPAAHWARESIELLAARGIVSGSGGRFYPDRKVTRAEFVKMLAGVLSADVDSSGPSVFEDVSAQSWKHPYIAWAAANGIVSGTDPSHFAPDAPITREQIAAILSRCADTFAISLPQIAEPPAFNDAASISAYARTAVASMAQAGVIGGYTDGSFRPSGSATRAEAAKLLAGFSAIMEG